MPVGPCNAFVCPTCDFHYGLADIEIDGHGISRDQLEECRKDHPRKVIVNCDTVMETVEGLQKWFCVAGYYCRKCNISFNVRPSKSIECESCGTRFRPELPHAWMQKEVPVGSYKCLSGFALDYKMVHKDESGRSIVSTRRRGRRNRPPF